MILQLENSPWSETVWLEKQRGWTRKHPWQSGSKGKLHPCIYKYFLIKNICRKIDAAPGYAEEKRQKLRDMVVRTKDEEYTRTMIEEGLNLAKQSDAEAQIIGNLYTSQFMKEEVIFI